VAAALHSVICSACGVRFEAVRDDASTCSARCRTRLYRTRLVAREDADRARTADLLSSLAAAARLLPAE
jgi:hypothetical protein